MTNLNIAAAFIAGILDGFGWMRARDRVSRRITWTGKALDAFDISADWLARPHYGKKPEPSAPVDFDLENIR